MDLKTYLSDKDRPIDVAEFARRLSVSKEAIRLWASGKRTPRPEFMRRIMTETGGAVTPNDFLTATQAAE